MAGYEEACYGVTVMVDGKPVMGYVQGTDLVAVAEFERRRAAAAVSSVNGQQAAKSPSIAAQAPHYRPFQDFSAPDMKGRLASIHGLRGKVNLVCFWSPGHENASRELLVVNRLYGKFKTRGVDALAVSLPGDRAMLEDALDDFQLGFQNVPDRYDIAARHNVGYETLPRTYVLNENFEVIASGLHNKALEDLVKKLVDGNQFTSK